jgi:hypothetical protein
VEGVPWRKGISGIELPRRVGGGCGAAGGNRVGECGGRASGKGAAEESGGEAGVTARGAVLGILVGFVLYLSAIQQCFSFRINQPAVLSTLAY